jgi:phage tail sheath protein FI
MAYKTPGVYIEEISVFPPSVAEVPTAIPAFIGYTEKAERKGEDLTNVPTKISSLLEYKELFGGDYKLSSISIQVGDKSNNYPVTSVTVNNRYYMYESIRLFFDNGGGNCYIVSVGKHNDKKVELGDETAQDKPGLKVGLKALEKYDEPTIILFPDAVLLTDEAQLYTLQQHALSQCAKLQDRVAVFDLMERVPTAPHIRPLSTAVDNFRDKIGINNLKYGAAYTPWLSSTYTKEVGFNLFRNNVKDAKGNPLDLGGITSDSDLNALVTTVNTAITDQETIKDDITNLFSSSPTLKDRYAVLRNAVSSSDDGSAAAAFKNLIDFVQSVAEAIPPWQKDLKGTNLLSDLNTYAADDLKTAVNSLIQMEKNVDVQVLTGRDEAAVIAKYTLYDATQWLEEYDTGSPPGNPVTDIQGSLTDYGDPNVAPYAAALKVTAELDGIFNKMVQFISDIQSAALIRVNLAQQVLYNQHTIIGNMVELIKRDLATVPPSGAVAGVYAHVDNTRGVWKAPANVSLSSVRAPIVPIDHFEQEDLNIDVNAGKSINAIRTFTGRGDIVWGARTLAGNDNEWRYVSVRRFFNMVEESVKKSTAWAVFEPNAAPLWTRVKGMIDNYLIQKWREGALAGATPDEAFFVRVGLGQTMTAQDILEGRLNVEIGMAVVRPAEFIILKFSHKMQES